MKHFVFCITCFAVGACGAPVAAPPIETPAPKAAAMTPASLVGKTWIAQVEGVLDREQRPRLQFTADGRVTGYTGCNTLGGSWQLSDDRVAISGLAMTKRACLGAGNELEKRFLAAVGPKSRLVIQGTRLVAQGEAGARLEFAPDAGS